jgi:hypothetical protein
MSRDTTLADIGHSDWTEFNQAKKRIANRKNPKGDQWIEFDESVKGTVGKRVAEGID